MNEELAESVFVDVGILEGVRDEGLDRVREEVEGSGPGRLMELLENLEIDVA